MSDTSITLYLKKYDDTISYSTCIPTVFVSIFLTGIIGWFALINSYLNFLSAAKGAIAVIDVFHTLTFKRTNLLLYLSTNYSTLFWLTARFLETVALILASLLIR